MVMTSLWEATEMIFFMVEKEMTESPVMEGTMYWMVEREMITYMEKLEMIHTFLSQVTVPIQLGMEKAQIQ